MTAAKVSILRRLFLMVAFSAIAILLDQPAMAQSEKELRTKTATPVILVNLLSSLPDCTSNPGSIAVPVIREKPTNGRVSMQIIATDVAASQNCPARRVPTIALVYTPNKDFVGADSIQVEIEVANRTTALRYRVTVADAAQRL